MALILSVMFNVVVVVLVITSVLSLLVRCFDNDPSLSVFEGVFFSIDMVGAWDCWRFLLVRVTAIVVSRWFDSGERR